MRQHFCHYLNKCCEHSINVTDKEILITSKLWQVISTITNTIYLISMIFIFWNAKFSNYLQLCVIFVPFLTNFANKLSSIYKDSYTKYSFTLLVLQLQGEASTQYAQTKLLKWHNLNKLIHFKIQIFLKRMVNVILIKGKSS